VKDLSENAFNSRLSRNDPKLKIWRNAGLLLTYKCNARCAFCYYNCGPGKGGLMEVKTALNALRSIKTLAGKSARTHITGGEPFLFPGRLFEILSAAQKQGLGPADLVETNGFWGGDENLARQYLGRLADLGVRRLKISVDPFHLEFIDIDKVRRLAALAEEILGSGRVQVRWRQYLVSPRAEAGSGTERDRLFLRSIKEHPCRFTGRAAGRLAESAADKPLEKILRENCKRDFLAAAGIHVDPYGNVFSSTCSGIIIGNVNDTPVERMWETFDPSRASFIRELFNEGPAGLLQEAAGLGYRPAPSYADKCHLCTSIRRFLFERSAATDAVGPGDCYEGD
jgi:hypothetical protein